MAQAQQNTDGRWHEWTRGDRLRVARESISDSQKEFAEISGISRNTVSRYENNGTPRELYVKQWALATGYSYKWLMFGEIPGEGTVTATASEGYLPDYLVALPFAA